MNQNSYMKIKMTLLASVFFNCGSLVLEAKSFSVLDRLPKEVLKEKLAAKSRKLADNCTNFAGDWVGRCYERNNSDKFEESKITLTQNGCSSMGEGILEAPNHGAVSAQIAHPVQDWEHLNGNISLSGAWNDAQTKFTVVEQMTIPALSMHFITSKSYQLDGDTLAVSDSDHVAMYNEYGVPQDDFNLVKYDCRYNKRQN